MTIVELLQACETIQDKFPTLVAVKPDKEGKELTLEVKDFSPRKEQNEMLKLTAKVHELKDSGLKFQVDKQEKVAEVYLYLGSVQYNDVALINLLVKLSSVTTLKKTVQFVTPNLGENNIGIILRSFIDADNNSTDFSDRLLHAIKEILSVSYHLDFISTIRKIEETIDDKEMVENLMDKHQRSIEQLLDIESEDESL